MANPQSLPWLWEQESEKVEHREEQEESKGKDAGATGAAVSTKSARGHGEVDGDGEEDENERKARRHRFSIQSRTTIMTDLPVGWSGHAVTRQSSSQADIWMMAPDGSKLRSVVDVDHWYLMNNRVLSRHDRKLFEQSCRVVRRKAAKLYQRQIGREVASEDDDAPGRGGAGEAARNQKRVRAVPHCGVCQTWGHTKRSKLCALYQKKKCASLHLICIYLCIYQH